MIGEDGRPRRSQEPQGAGLILTHFGTGDRVRLFLMADKDLAACGALYELQASGYHLVETTLTIDESSKVSLLLSNFAGGQNDNNK